MNQPRAKQLRTDLSHESRLQNEPRVGGSRNPAPVGAGAQRGGVMYLPPESALDGRGENTTARGAGQEWSDEELEGFEARASRGIDAKRSEAARQEFHSVEFYPALLESHPELRESLAGVARLVANVTESYTASIFLVSDIVSNNGAQKRVLSLAAVQSLSRELVLDAQIGFGCGLVGWTAENGVRISVCPFEHDATTLLYYSRDQALKSFIAVPIINGSGTLIGVLSCDSKKSYAFAKITEKILTDCAAQVASLIDLHQAIKARSQKPFISEDRVAGFLETLRTQRNERALLSAISELPLDIVDRDALVVITTDEGRLTEGRPNAHAVHSASNQVRVGHRLLELVCRHKKIICPDRSVQTLAADDSTHRSFLSIPFHVMRREAGSLNLLSRPFEAFSAEEIGALERIAMVVGKELEFLRLRESAASAGDRNGLLTWRRFAQQSASFLEDAKRTKTPLALVRFVFTNLHEIEDYAGAEAASSVLSDVMRLIEQVKRSSSPACYLYGTQAVVLTEASEAERMSMRLHRLLERLAADDNLSGGREKLGLKFGQMLLRGLKTVTMIAPRDGETIEELTAKSLRMVDQTLQFSSVKQTAPEVLAHASNW